MIPPVLPPRKSLSDEAVALIVSAATRLEWEWRDHGERDATREGRWQLGMSDPMSAPGFHRWHLANNRQYFDNPMESAVSTMQCFWVWTVNGGGVASIDTPALSEAAREEAGFTEDQRPGIVPAEKPQSAQASGPPRRIVRQELEFFPWPTVKPGEAFYFGILAGVGMFPRGPVQAHHNPGFDFYADFVAGNGYQRYAVPVEDRILVQLVGALSGTIADSINPEPLPGMLATMGDVGIMLSQVGA